MFFFNSISLIHVKTTYRTYKMDKGILGPLNHLVLLGSIPVRCIWKNDWRGQPLKWISVTSRGLVSDLPADDTFGLPKKWTKVVGHNIFSNIRENGANKYHTTASSGFSRLILG
jgi:hypothetical protein